MNTRSETSDHTQYLTFFLSNEEYAIDALRVREIIEYDVVTAVPGTPPSIRGVINLRGSVVPVLDLCVRFGLPPSPVTKRTCIVIVEVPLEGERAVIGVLADSVSRVIGLAPGQIEPPPAFGTRARVDHLVGMGKSDKKFVLILDADRILSASEAEAATAAVSAEAPAAS